MLERRSTFLLTDKAKSQLCLPSELKYEACSRIPVKILISATNAATSDAMLDNVHVHLIKTTTITSRDNSEVPYEETLGIASFCERDGWTPPYTEAKSGMVVRTAHGWVWGGQPQGEMAWGISGMIKVEVSSSGAMIIRWCR